ncbi:hypothetical protein [Alteromonas mediterranea]|uniref:Uncharacterized protein n=1 Tax=Alteromonas mediterranea (strain DSM 17117 / CIP 110805 / LMG 28347 / Deep ecotype) TaxID=1774373 RepID=F2GCB1_ALTMD|nr:hypothetical protein [Alteromonas mediterranea]AEA99067.1 hypothetical protein MADE_1014665 [Alteromonas mediterranea DE]
MALTAWAQEAKAKREAWYKIERLEAQLAKANERIEELEHYNLRLANESHAKSLEIDSANKSVIETHVKALQSLLNKKCPVSGYVIRDKESREIIVEELEQLLKEQSTDVR